MSKWNPDSSRKLEGADLSGEMGSRAQVVPDDTLDDGEMFPDGLNGAFAGGGGVTAGDYADDDGDAMGVDDMSVPGARLPGAPKDTDPFAERDVKQLITSAPMTRRTAPITDGDLMLLARQSYDNSVNYFNSSHRQRIIDAMARFNSEHPSDSKYHSSAYERRSKVFRPKTRATTRKREAAACLALFSSADIVNVTPTRSDADSSKDAKIQESLLNYRLQQDDRWYRTIVGAVQDAERQGFAVGKTYWEYEEANKYYDEIHPTLGKQGRVDTVATKDRPGFGLVPLERFFFSPAADWMNLVESSPYLIEVIPMYLCDVRKYQNNPRARLQYRNLSTGQLLSGGKSSEWDSIRTQRERNTQNRYDRGSDVTDYAVVWVHRNIMKIEGEDYVYDTIGTSMMLSNVIPLSEFDPRGYRPYVVGSTLVESHNPMNVGGVTLMGPMQDEINDIANLRMDANKMATAGRMFVKRNTGLDLHALARFSPGAVVEMDNPAQDIKWDRAPEAPNGAFEEGQLMNTELDDLMGNFSTSTVGNARNLNETVGGMQMMGQAADQMSEYDIHTFCSTFVGKMLNQIIDLEKQWETDQTIAAIIGEKLAADAKRFWQALDTETKVIVNVGYGATNPQKRMERIMMAVSAMTQAAPMMMQMADQGAIAGEIWSAAGFPDASRFFPFLDQKQGQMDPDPKVKALQLQVQQLQAAADPVQAKMKNLLDLEQLRQKGQTALQDMKGQQAMDIQKAENEMALNIKVLELRLAYVELQLEKEKNEIARAQLMLEREKLSNDITMQRLQFNLERLTAQASAIAPVVAQDADAERESEQLRAPGSNLALPDFGQNVATAGQYVDQGQQTQGDDQ